MHREPIGLMRLRCTAGNPWKRHGRPTRPLRVARMNCRRTPLHLLR